MIQTSTIMKICLMFAFFLEVVIFGRFISNLKCFSEGQIMSVAMTFSGSLFISIAMLDIIPEAIAGFDSYFTQIKTSLSSSSSLHSNEYLPLTMIIACITFMIIMYIDKILIGHSHDHEYEVSFIKEPRKSARELHNNGIQLKEIPQMHEIHHKNDEKAQQKAEQIYQVSNERKIQVDHHSHSPKAQKHEQGKNYRPFILQAGMSIHAFFQCLAVGLQKTPIGVLSLASAILVHKWAQGLTLGLIYKKEGYSNKTSTIMVVVQGCVNVLGLITGTSLIGQGHFIMAFFMSISAGTFLYISLAEVLLQQIQTMNKTKFFTMFMAIGFISLLVWIEKFSEEIAEKHQNR